MSLNGLDAQPVTDAYYAAIVEVGGWFLLKYTSRDSVELLSRGKGGVHEARNELLKYEEKSPLYGLIIYRRRKVLIKYIPDGTSRLLQGTSLRRVWVVALTKLTSRLSSYCRPLPGCRRTLRTLRNSARNIPPRRTERHIPGFLFPTPHCISRSLDDPPGRN